MGENEELIREMLEALKEARELVESWGACADNYFQVKHDLDGDLAHMDAAIAKAQAALDGKD